MFVRRAKGERLAAGRLMVGASRVCEDEGVSRRRVPKIIVDAHLLEHSGDEVQVALAVLHEVLGFGVVAR